MFTITSYFGFLLAALTITPTSIYWLEQDTPYLN